MNSDTDNDTALIHNTLLASLQPTSVDKPQFLDLENSLNALLNLDWLMSAKTEQRGVSMDMKARPSGALQVLDGDVDTPLLDQWPETMECHCAPISELDKTFGDTLYTVTDLRSAPYHAAGMGSAEALNFSPEGFCPSAAQSDDLKDFPEVESVNFSLEDFCSSTAQSD